MASGLGRGGWSAWRGVVGGDGMGVMDSSSAASIENRSNDVDDQVNGSAYYTEKFQTSTNQNISRDLKNFGFTVQ